jgi:hypothetical protein
LRQSCRSVGLAVPLGVVGVIARQFDAAAKHRSRPPLRTSRPLIRVCVSRPCRMSRTAPGCIAPRRRGR